MTRDDNPPPFDWAPYRFGSVGVDCLFTPRPTCRGMPLREGLAELAGTRLKLWPLWLMDDDDNYPGEWALSTKNGRGVFPSLAGGPLWIASGDVTIITTDTPPNSATLER